MDAPFSSQPRCPICRTPVRWTDNPFRPFCSERCRMVDLGNWAAERYRIPETTTPRAGAAVDDDDSATDD